MSVNLINLKLMEALTPHCWFAQRSYISQMYKLHANESKTGAKLCLTDLHFFTARPAPMADNMQQNSIQIPTLPQLGLTTIRLHKAGSNCGERIKLNFINMPIFHHVANFKPLIA